MKKSILVAYNIHSGGGKVLLDCIIDLIPNKDEYLVFLDSRYNNPKIKFLKNIKEIRVLPNLFSRLKAEYIIKKNSSYYENTICFGNLPPLFKLKNNIFIYVQNKLIIEPSIIFKNNMKSHFEKIWFRFRKSKNYHYFVQTKSMKESLQSFLGSNYQISIGAFYPTIKPPDITQTMNQFIYVASGEPHKNHKNLIKAWVALKEENISPNLVLILNRKDYPTLSKWIEDINLLHSLNINIIDNLKYQDILVEYKKSLALIFPSKLESLGLPLLEAKALNIPIISSELDFVRDLVTPVETFNPDSPLSIARAVKRFLNIEKNDILTISPRDLINGFS